MINQESLSLGQTRSVIRELFEYGNQRAKVVGRENIFDFSIGNPSVPPPPQVSMEIERLIREMEPCLLHGYTSAAGDPEVRTRIASGLRLANLPLVDTMHRASLAWCIFCVFSFPSICDRLQGGGALSYLRSCSQPGLLPSCLE